MGIFGRWHTTRRELAEKRAERARAAAREALLAVPKDQVESVLVAHFEASGFEVRPWQYGGLLDLELIDGGSTLLLQHQNWRDIRTGESRVAAMHRAGVAFGAVRTILVSAGTFTWGAERLAARLGVELVDGDDLIWMLSRYGSRRQRPMGLNLRTSAA